jgi:hypothetical protein
MAVINPPCEGEAGTEKNCLVALLNCVQLFSWAGVVPTGPGHVKCRGLGERDVSDTFAIKPSTLESGIHGTPHYLNFCYLRPRDKSC